MRKILVFSASIFLITGMAGCAAVNPAMVSLGLAEAPPPVTDSVYFNKQTDLLLDRIRASQTKTFRRVAALDFINPNGQVSELGRYLTGKFSERALAKQSFKVTPQGQVREALAKLKITSVTELTREQAEKLGTELDVDAIATGMVADLQKGSDVDLTVKIIHSASGEMVSAGSVNIYRSKQVQTLIQQF
ncbi:MAG: hypothetical protein HY751_06340 [Nitrospinae bacterium]|nr:hypothetical protein [Nitrospinota bacterium]